MNGTSATTGKPLQGIEHLKQSVRDILATPVGSRVMRRDYGSRLHELVDAPMNRATVVAIVAATAGALARWEPRLRVTKVAASLATAGAIEISLQGVYLPEGKTISLTGIQVR